MFRTHHLGKFKNFVPKNYTPRMPKDICQVKLRNEIDNLLDNPIHIPSVIRGKKIKGSQTYERVSPGYNKTPIYTYDYLSSKDYSELRMSETPKYYWNNVPVETKFNLFERIADLVEGKYFYKMMAATMVGQGKNQYEAELDCIAETVDFLRFNIGYAKQIYEKQPVGEGNYSQYLPLQGRVAAITPFNFTAIAANLSTAPLYFGNMVYWKPSEKSLLSNYLFYNICIEAGLPSEILNFVLMKPTHYVEEVVRKNTGGILFTGSTDVFTKILGQVNYKKQFPRIIGETGGKNFHFVHETANIDSVVEKTYQAAFGYAGQKCSACSIIYLPKPMEADFISKINEFHKKTHADEKTRYCLIDHLSYNRTVNTIHNAEKDNYLELVMGGNYSDESSYYVEPTIYKVNGDHPIIRKELFAPILLIKTYDPLFLNLALHECANLSDYKLTGAIFSNENRFINMASNKFESSCGNFYINDKCTGSVVGQQPFGGFGKSGTNDKAGDINLMMRLFNQRNIKFNKTC